jgi:crotonobetainyl-CoA:carnitine CoA-transferase CaiB-like acyl-CoA transferase
MRAGVDGLIEYGPRQFSFGKVPVEASAYIMSRTPGRVERGAPTLGRDNAYVLEKVLGYSPERIAALGTRGVLK